MPTDPRLVLEVRQVFSTDSEKALEINSGWALGS